MEAKSQFDTIEMWLDGALSEEESRAFEEKLKVDEVLREQVELHRRARAEIEEALRRDFIRKTALWRKDLESLPPPPSIDPPAKGGSAAFKNIGIIALLFISAIALFGLFSKRPWVFLRNGAPINSPTETDTLPHPPRADASNSHD